MYCLETDSEKLKDQLQQHSMEVAEFGLKARLDSRVQAVKRLLIYIPFREVCTADTRPKQDPAGRVWASVQKAESPRSNTQ